ANIACGAHAGDFATMRATIALAQKHAVGIGAHPGFADREHFGRRELALSPAEIRELVTGQITRLAELATLRHVKPHGALYNLAARDATVAEAVVMAVRSINPALVLYAPPLSELARIGREKGLRVALEGFADRTYQSDGKLTPRTQRNALITDEALAVAQVLQIVGRGSVCATDGTEISIAADTICLHGDGAHAVAFATHLNRDLRAAGVELRGLE
ncbi:MAG: 5-oxoprolinase subunit PxpA, partial [Opitutaceae bacterium]